MSVEQEIKNIKQEIENLYGSIYNAPQQASMWAAQAEEYGVLDMYKNLEKNTLKLEKIEGELEKIEGKNSSTLEAVRKIEDKLNSTDRILKDHSVKLEQLKKSVEMIVKKASKGVFGGGRRKKTGKKSRGRTRK